MQPVDQRARSRHGAGADAHGAPVPDARMANARGLSPLTPRVRKIVVAVVAIVTLAGGAGLSAIPFSPQEVVRTVHASGSPVTMRMEQTGRGFPFKVYVLERGPIEAPIKTDAIIGARVAGFVLNMGVVALAQLLLIGFIRRRQRIGR